MANNVMMDKANALRGVPMNPSLTTGVRSASAHLRLLTRLLFGLFILAAIPLANLARTGDSTPALPDALISTPGATATLLPNGHWLLLGAKTRGNLQASARLYDQASGRVLTLDAGLARPRTHHTATLLDDGRVLILGGVDATSTPLAAAEVFDPQHSAFHAMGDLGLLARSRHAVTRLADGRLLITGGVDDHGLALAEAELLDPSSGRMETLTPHPGLAQPRADHTASLLADGKVLILGGEDETGAPLAQAEVFDPQTSRFQSLGLPDPRARSRHAATLLADGRVLITGGMDSQGVPLAEVELLDPGRRTLQRLAGTLSTARMNHLSALLPDHGVLVWGGVGVDGLPAPGAELFDPDTQQFTVSTADSVAADLAALATPQAPQVHDSDPVPGEFGVAPDKTLSVRFSKPLASASLNAETVALIGPDGHVPTIVTPTEGGLVVFVRPTQDLLPGADYTLVIQGAADGRAQPLEFFALGFKTRTLAADPQDGKDPGAATGPAARRNRTGGLITTPEAGPTAARPSRSPTQAEPTASTAAPPEDRAEAQDAAGEAWIPGPEHRKGHWKSGRRFAHSRDTFREDREFHALVNGMGERARLILSERMAARGELKARLVPASLPGAADLTAAAAPNQDRLTGQVLRLNGQPLANATLSMAGIATRTDARGEFVLAGVPQGEQLLVIDGRSADMAGRHYGRFEYRMVVEPGLNALDFTIWMPLLDTRHAVSIASPTTAETVVTNPDLPGLELHIPAGTVIRDADGKIATEVSITPVPGDQLPFPMPYAEVPIFYTIQPGGATFQSVSGRAAGATLVYPNYSTQPAGARLPLFDYDPRGRGWYIYAMGTVSPDAKSIQADKPFTIYQITVSSAASPGGIPPDTGPTCSGASSCKPPGGCDGDPVTCADGLFLEGATDLALNDVMPLSLTRTYRQNDANQRAFGVGTNHGLDLFLYFVNSNGWEAEAVEVILPSGGRVRFNPLGSAPYTLHGTVWESTLPGEFYKAQLRFSSVNGGSGFWVTLKDGRRFGFSYYQSRLLIMEDRNGNRTTIFRDGSNRVSRVVSPQGRFIEFAYLAPTCTGCISAATDSTGRTATYTYDAQGRLVAVTDPAGGVTRYAYDAQHRMTSVTDPRGIVKVANTFSTAGLVTGQTYADGKTMAFSYLFDSNLKIVQTDVTHERGDIRRIIYDASGSPASDTAALGSPEQQTTSYLRNANNLVTQMTDPLGRVTAYEYDARGNTTKVTRLFGTASAISWSFTYEPVYNQLRTVKDPLNHVTTLSYDGLGNLIQIADPLANRLTMTYDTLGRPRTVTRYNGTTALTNTFTYDGPDLVKITDPLGRMTTLTPDLAGRVLSVRDPLDRLTRFTYDAVGRVLAVFDPQGNATRYAYDGNDNLLTFTDALNRVTRFTYDTRNRVTTKTDALLRTETYQYDAGGNLLFVTDRKGQVTGFQYDFLGRVIRAGYGATSTISPVYANTTTYVYDRADRLMSVQDSLAGTITRTYDDRFDTPASETTPEGTVSYAYAANGLRQTMTPSGGTAITYSYDTADRLTQISQAAGTGGGAIPAAAQTVRLAYDTASRQTSLTLPNGIIVAYAYDNADQLTAINYSNAAGTALGGLTYTYDAAGRRTALGGSLAQSGLPTAIGVAQYDANNRLIRRDTLTYTYDANGNLLSDGVRTYTWNARDQLVSVAGGGETAAYLYDGLGRRRQATIGGVATATLYDGWNPVQLKSGATVVENRLVGLGLDANYARVRGGSVESYLTDALGSTLQLRDGAQVMTAGYVYDPYGGTTGAPAGNNVARYTGREQDLADLYYYRHRYYKPSVGRFISEDPIGLAGGANVYLYAANSPADSSDPVGLTAETKEYMQRIQERKLWWEWIIRKLLKVWAWRNPESFFEDVATDRIAETSSGVNPDHLESIMNHVPDGAGLVLDRLAGRGPEAFFVSPCANSLQAQSDIVDRNICYFYPAACPRPLMKR